MADFSVIQELELFWGCCVPKYFSMFLHFLKHNETEQFQNIF